MSSSAAFYDKDRSARRNTYLTDGQPRNDSTERFLNYAANCISDGKEVTTLDLGTGNGYVPLMLATKYHKAATMIGVDLSADMVAIAKEKTQAVANITIAQWDNFHLESEDEKFDLVTNKLSTHFSMGEVFRVLKPGGAFVFKEYGLGKGMVEIAQIFQARMNTTDPLSYVHELRNTGFREYGYEQSAYQARYTLSEIGDILASAPIINDYDPSRDLATIRKKLGSENIILTSDPFLIYATK